MSLNVINCPHGAQYRSTCIAAILILYGSIDAPVALPTNSIRRQHNGPHTTVTAREAPCKGRNSRSRYNEWATASQAGDQVTNAGIRRGAGDGTEASGTRACGRGGRVH